MLGTNGVRRLEAGGPVVGLLSSAPYEQETVQLEPGDTLVVFSDGVSEALQPRRRGVRRRAPARRGAAAARRSAPQALVQHLIAAVREFTHGAAQSDDITAMVVHYRGA